MSRFISFFTVSANVSEDLVRGFTPDEGLGVGVVGHEVGADGLLEFGGATVRAAAYLLLGDQGQPALHQV